MSAQSIDNLKTILERALKAIANSPAPDFKRALDYFASNDGIELPKLPLTVLTSYLEKCGPNDPLLDHLALAIHGWDHRDVSWLKDTAPHSEERRKTILDRLGFSGAQQSIVNRRIPRVSEIDLPIVIAEDHEPWYDEKRRSHEHFFWDHYTQQLLPPNGKWKAEDVELLGFSVDDVISRLSDPCRSEIFPVRGLVMGYVQSGKTSHFSGLIAKAADAGYRFIIVLAGTLDILRQQTQRRIDKEIVGRELLTEEEYGQDSDWDSFVAHGGRPSDLGAFDWDRLTNSDDDYQSLERRLSTLEFKAHDRSKPFNHPDNLQKAAVKLAIIKKRPARLKQLNADLKGLRGLSKLEHVPTLIIDDESDQASINTIDQRKPGNAGERTSTNQHIVELLKLLPRAQYVGYTATPFANVFVDPDDADGLFPKDFIISLRRPDGYMGVSDFYDFGQEYVAGDYKGNKNAFVRPVEGGDEQSQNLPEAIDAFVLTGALKLFREHANSRVYRFRHHTMLIHHSATQVVHTADKRVVENIFREGARYQRPSGLASLKRLYEDDFAPVSAARAKDVPHPKSFDELKPFISQCITKLCADKPVRIVNGQHRDDTPDFDAGSVWAILVGGTKLSRGYTVEGLTISYYRRPTGAGDTLMQMGRWFGFRNGYKDLVRLYIGRKEKRGNITLDLYEAFGAVCRDEEALRDDLRKYSVTGLKPWQVPPLVHQHLPELPPTSRNRMFNAEIKSFDYAGRWTEKTSAPTRQDQIADNLEAATILLNASRFGSRTQFAFSNSNGLKRTFDVMIGTTTGESVLTFLKEYTWADGRHSIDLEVDYIGKSLPHGSLQSWTVMLPQLGPKHTKTHIVPGLGRISVISRSRVADSRFGVYSEPRHVEAAKAIAGVAPVSKPSDGLKSAMRSKSPVLVLYLVTEEGGDSQEVSVGFAIQYPGVKLPTAIRWGVRLSDKEGHAVVPKATPQGRSKGSTKSTGKR
jgi:hypothetical protein